MSWYFDTENWAAGIWNSWAEERTDTWREAMVRAVWTENDERDPAGAFAFTPPGVSGGISKNHLLWMPPILVIGFGSKGGDLELLLTFEDDHHAKLSSNGNSSFKERLDLVGQSRSHDVIITRLASE